MKYSFLLESHKVALFSGSPSRLCGYLSKVPSWVSNFWPQTLMMILWQFPLEQSCGRRGGDLHLIPTGEMEEYAEAIPDATKDKDLDIEKKEGDMFLVLGTVKVFLVCCIMLMELDWRFDLGWYLVKERTLWVDFFIEAWGLLGWPAMAILSNIIFPFPVDILLPAWKRLPGDSEIKRSDE